MHLSYYLMSHTMVSFIPVGITYATWSGLGHCSYNNYWQFLNTIKFQIFLQLLVFRPIVIVGVIIVHLP